MALLLSSLTAVYSGNPPRNLPANAVCFFPRKEHDIFLTSHKNRLISDKFPRVLQNHHAHRLAMQ